MSDSNVNEFEFSPEHDGSLSLESAIFQAIGSASMCWEHVDKAGIFQSDQAKVIGDALVKFVNDYKYPRPTGHIIDIGPQCFTDGEVINWKGANFYKACDAWVTNREDGGQTFCTKRVGHPGFLHEDYNGNVRGDHP